MSEHDIALTVAAIGLTGFACQWAAWRMKLPAILLLLLAGLIAGPVTNLLEPNLLFGDLLFPLVSLCVAIILFEGSLTLEFSQLKEVGNVVKRLISFGAITTLSLTATACHFVLDFSWGLSLLFGSLTVVTGPTVIVPLLRTVRPNSKIANTLRWEGILIDPIGALCAVLVFEFLASGAHNGEFSHVLVTFATMLAVGLSSGIAAGILLARMLRNHWLPEYLHNIATLSILLTVFVVSNQFADESGLLAVTVFGIWLANAKEVNVQQILHFKENLTVLLISGLFILLAARIEWADLITLGWPMLALLAIIQFVVRPIAISVSTFGSQFNWRERALLAWIAPRGIVAAAISALFALKLAEQGIDHANLLVPATFAVIIGTVVLQSLTAAPIARLLGVAEPSPSGFLIIGANSLARKIGGALQDAGFRVVLTDSIWENISAARLLGLKTYFGNPASSHADEYLDLTGIGHMLALTPQRHQNVMSGMRFIREFGSNKTFCIKTRSRDTAKHRASIHHRGMTLFNADTSFQQLASLVANGGEIKSTRLSKEFSYEDYLAKNQDDHIVPLFAIDDKQHIHVYAESVELKPGLDWKIIAMITPAKKENNKPTEAAATKS
ncbi:sodium/proton antiporter (CPA1 family) [Sinobacterium caligoides]|uniref:Sodium/proton antiporter (CPA1 family) n=1 Tax=Sinobacterium caligoides TaxID=933926 RepID=A0A3N2DZK9_9GAMM|nr:sodium:proton antiporter [Sinobacterium caligoides]ROS04869.1 sodium/proton antiporter (CPA1 family) [Sinobacterium caligoides]